MKRGLVRSVGISGIALFSTCWSTASFGIDVDIDQFTVHRGTATFFNDGFDDNVPPPAAPAFVTGAAASYSVFGTIPAGAEAAGLLHLDSANGALTANAVESPRLLVQATLLTSTTGGATQLGIGDVLEVSGTFGLTIPTGPLYSGYGVRFTDAAAGVTHQLAQIQVQWGEGLGEPRILYLMQDFDANSFAMLGNVALAPPAGADQIRLTITRPDTANNDFFGSFAYLSGGVVVGGGSFDAPAALFDGESYVRAQFFAAEAIATPVPEPEVFVLLGIGGAFVVARRRRAARIR